MAFDYVNVDLVVPRFGIPHSFQTKDFDCEYSYYLIDLDGQLKLTCQIGATGPLPEALNYTGVIEIHDDFNRFLIDFENGHVVSIKCAETNEDIEFFQIKNVN